MRSAGGIEPSGSAGERRRALRRRGLHDGRDFGRSSPRAGGAIAFSLALCRIFGSSLGELTSASVDDGSVGGAGRGTRVGRGSVAGLHPAGRNVPAREGGGQIKTGQCGRQMAVGLRAYSVSGWEGRSASDVTGHKRPPEVREFRVGRRVGQL